MNTQITDLIKETISKIQQYESRERARSTNAQQNFEYAVTAILIDLWKASFTVPASECLINKRNGYYSKNRRYKHPLMTYKQTMAAFDGLLMLGYIEVTKEGYFDRTSLQGALTKFIARDELSEQLRNIDGLPAITLPTNIDRETIVLRDIIDGERKVIDYTDTPKTDLYRNNLKRINQCFLRHWADLEIKDTEIEALEKRIAADNEKQPIDFSARTLTRIFSNGSFKEGGRFYRGWWQNVPSEYREFITIDMKRTCEYDFSQLNPHMIY